MLSQRLVSQTRRLPVLLQSAFRQCRRLHTARLPAGAERFITVSEEVKHAVATGKPVVALESTIYTHGLPYPENAKLAQGLESIVRKEGAIPATIGVINGVARVGLVGDEVTQLASAAENSKVLKVSRRDLGYILGNGLRGKGIYGGTTVAGTSVLANMAGIEVFATGGLGGVHRGGEISMDVSADLTEMGRTPIAVVCSGCKSFLDIPRTLEYLETEGVMVGVFADGRTDDIDFPGFYSRDSGFKAPKVLENEADAAAMIYASHSLKLTSGMVLANPVPAESGLKKEDMDNIIQQALEEARRSGILGSDNTPFVLAKIKELSNGRSVIANTALVKNNVRRGARVAVELAKLKREQRSCERPNLIIPVASIEEPSGNRSSNFATNTVDVKKQGNVVVAGSVAIDFACDYAPLTQAIGTQPALQVSNPSVINQSLGGVGHNVARAIGYMGTPVTLCSVVANDFGGRTVLTELQRDKIRTDGITVMNAKESNKRTAQYIAVNDAKKDLMIAMADMSILEAEPDQLDFQKRWQPLFEQEKPSWLVIDANWSAKTITKWLSLAKRTKTKVAFESVSAPKSARLFMKDNATMSNSHPPISPADIIPNNVIDLANPNNHELAAMWAAARAAGLFDGWEWFDVIDSFNITGSGSRQMLEQICGKDIVDQGIPQQSIQLLPYIPCIITKLGSKGALLTQVISFDDARLTSPDHMKYVLGRAPIPQKGVNKVGGIYMRLFPPAEMVDPNEVVSVNGVGDTLLGAIVAGLANQPEDEHFACLQKIVPVAQMASVETLKSSAAVSPRISRLEKELKNIN
ncbi:hypothetical protein KEM54_001581 [Ascosphaera aggregata]|nr:hypothetical protein KEM54_001581 [Ascosphaera aggregata]